MPRLLVIPVEDVAPLLGELLRGLSGVLLTGRFRARLVELAVALLPQLPSSRRRSSSLLPRSSRSSDRSRSQSRSPRSRSSSRRSRKDRADLRPRTMSAPAMPLETWSAVAPCRCVCYQKVPAGWSGGISYSCWKLTPGLIEIRIGGERRRSRGVDLRLGRDLQENRRRQGALNLRGSKRPGPRTVQPNRDRERGPIRGAGTSLRSLHHETVLREPSRRALVRGAGRQPSRPGGTADGTDPAQLVHTRCNSLNNRSRALTDPGNEAVGAWLSSTARPSEAPPRSPPRRAGRRSGCLSRAHGVAAITLEVGDHP